MESVLTYILQINLLLAIVYLGYALLLKGLTFYRLNRVYLTVGSLYALAYPFLNIKAWFEKDVSLPLHLVMDYVDISLPVQGDQGLTGIDLLLFVFGVGGVLLLIRLLVQLLSLWRVHANSRPSKWGGYFFRDVLFPIVPFSFFNKIYVHEQQHVDAELYDIFKHEDVHVKGLHTVDVLLFEMLLIVCWYNPFVWLMRKAVRQNLEFLTDQQVLDKGVDRQTYQYSLLHVTKQGTAVGVGNQFNFKTLKKRIMMMNKKRSSKIELGKYAFMLPFMLLAGATFTVNKADGKISELVESIKEVQVAAVLPAPMGEQSLSDQDTLKGKFVGVSMDDGALQFEADQKGVPIETDGKDQLFVHGRVGFGEVLTVLDGVPVTKEAIDQVAPEDIEGIRVLKNESATALYGDKGKHGAVLITSKSGKAAKTLQGTFAGVRLVPTDTTKKIEGRVLRINATGRPGPRPLIILDGEPLADDYELSRVPPEKIESISILKDEAGTAIYGERAKAGVVLITSKKGAPISNSSSVKDTLYKGKVSEITVIGYSNKKQVGGSLSTADLDSQPEPQGGMTAFRKWIGDNYVYPEAAINAQVKGTVMVSFVVEKDGSLSDFMIDRDLNYGTGENALSLLKKSSNWKPGMKEGQPVRVQYALPIRLDVMTLQK